MRYSQVRRTPLVERCYFIGEALALIVLLFFTELAGANDLKPSVWTERSETVDPTRLPLGDKKFSSVPQRGYVLPCNPKSYLGTLGAHVFGPWIHGSTWDATEKIAVRGEVYWPQAFYRMSVNGDWRLFTTTELPVNEPTGTFPIRRTDPAYAVDTNPNAIRAQSTSFAVPLNPAEASSLSCVSIATVGIAMNGVPFYSALDVQGHDAAAHEVQDRCSGHPRPGGAYHYHSLSNCIPHVRERNALVGYALDGFGIFSPYDADGRELTTPDLDECHGNRSNIMWEGKEVNMYHYVLTRDFPYTIGCFRGTPTRLPIAPSSMLGRVAKFAFDRWHALLKILRAP